MFLADIPPPAHKHYWAPDAITPTLIQNLILALPIQIGVSTSNSDYAFPTRLTSTDNNYKFWANYKIQLIKDSWEKSKAGRYWREITIWKKG